MNRRTPIRKVSLKRAKLNREYSKLRDAFLEDHPYCQVWLMETFKLPLEQCEWIFQNQNGMGCPLAVDIHHTKKRGKYLLDTSTWLSVSRAMHEKIHREPKWAREKGYLV